MQAGLLTGMLHSIPSSARVPGCFGNHRRQLETKLQWRYTLRHSSKSPAVLIPNSAQAQSYSNGASTAQSVQEEDASPATLFPATPQYKSVHLNYLLTQQVYV